MEERESQRLQRYVTPSQSSSNRAALSDPNKYVQSTSAIVSEDRGAGKPVRNDKVIDRQRSYADGKGESVSPAQVPHERQRLSVGGGGRSGTLPPELAAPRSIGQYQQQRQQTSNQGRQIPAAAATYQHSVPSPYPSGPPVPSSSNFLPRQSIQTQQTGPRTPREDLNDRNRQFSTSLDRSDQFSPRLAAADPGTASQPRRYPEPQAVMVREAIPDHSRSQGHWRQTSYEFGEDRSGGREYSRPQLTSGGQTAGFPLKAVGPYQTAVPTRDERVSSVSTSQPDLMRYLDPTPDRLYAPAPTGEPLERPGEPYHPAAYPPPLPTHSRSASNPVILRAQGSNASASAVDSLFAYHQTSTPKPESTSPRQEPQSSQYVPPQAAVELISAQAQGTAPLKPPRLSSSATAAPYPYNYGLQNSDPHDHAEYAQQVTTITHVFLPRDAMYKRGLCRHAVRVSVCLCVCVCHVRALCQNE